MWSKFANVTPALDIVQVQLLWRSRVKYGMHEGLN